MDNAMVGVAAAPVKRKEWLRGEMNSQLLFGETVKFRSLHDEEFVHIDILLVDDHIVHTSVKVRIDNIDKQGMINSETCK